MRSLKSLRVFLAVVRHGSFSAASEHVSLTAAAVGLQMKSLEEELGFAVFDRSGKSVTLNHRGHRFAEKAKAIVDLLEEAKYDQDARELSGSMRIASISASMPQLIRAIIAMRASHPRIVVEGGISYSGNLKQRVLDGDIDGALTVRSPHDTIDDVIWTPLYKEPFAFVYSKRHFPSGKLDEMLERSIFFQSATKSNTGILIDELMRHHRIRARETIQVDAVRSILELVRDGLGVSIMPMERGLNFAAYPEVEFRRFEGPHSSRSVGFLENRKNSFLTSILRSQLAGQLSASDPARPWPRHPA